jgi:hypothetical protein
MPEHAMSDPKTAKEIIAFCRSEAARLRQMAQTGGFADAREELLDIAAQYDALARQYETGDGNSQGRK